MLVNMETTNQSTSITVLPTHWLTTLWRGLRSPKLTIATVIIIGLVLLMGGLLPQQSNVSGDMLPSFLQPWGEQFASAGAFRLLHTPLFWLPIAILLLNSLVVLADYGPQVWQRWRKEIAPMLWQHPLANRLETTQALSTDVVTPSFTTLHQALTDVGYTIHLENKNDLTIMSAYNRKWVWWSIPLIYSGLLLLVIAFIGSYYTLQIDFVTLTPLEQKGSSLLTGQFELTAVDITTQQAEVTYYLNDTKQALIYTRYRPVIVDGLFILPLEFGRLLTIRATDEEAQAMRLLPVQEDLAPNEQINLPVEIGTPIYFRIPAAGLNFQILPEPGGYNIQVLRPDETAPSINETVSLNEPFEVDGYTLHFEPAYNLIMLIYIDSMLMLYLLSLLIIVIGLLVLLLGRPHYLWFIYERYSTTIHLYGVWEQMGRIQETQQTQLDSWLALVSLTEMLEEKAVIEVDSNETSSKEEANKSVPEDNQDEAGTSTSTD